MVRFATNSLTQNICMKKLLYFLPLLVLLNKSCADVTTTNNNEKPENANPRSYQEGATIWYQHSGEMRALFYQAYNLATKNLEQYVKQPSSNKKPCVVVDVDETVLNNSPHQAWCILNRQVYPVGWMEWTTQAKAQALPGALEFLTYAAQNHVEVFYITNRKMAEREATITNLSALGFPNADTNHVLVKTKTSSKVERRNKVLQNFEIVLFVGDNLGDFDDFNQLNLVERNQKVDALKNNFGQKFIVLPNPMYGDWESVLYNYNYNQPDSILQKIRTNSLVGFDL